MVAATADRPTVAAVVIERRIELRCAACGRVVGVVGVRGDLPPGTVWTRIRCPDRRCTRWTAFDAATGQPFDRATHML